MRVVDQVNIPDQEFAKCPSKNLVLGEPVRLTKLPETFVLRFRYVEVLFIIFDLPRLLSPVLWHGTYVISNTC